MLYKVDLQFTSIFTGVQNVSTSVLTSAPTVRLCMNGTRNKTLKVTGLASSSVNAVLYLLNNALNEIPDLGSA